MITTDKKIGSVKYPLQTGFGNIDSSLNGGLRNGQLITLTAFCGEGTTPLALSIALNAGLKYNYRIVYISIEAEIDYLSRKMMSMQAQIPTFEFGNKPFSEEQRDRLDRLSNSNIAFLKVSSRNQLMDGCKALKYTEEEKGKVNLIIIDSINSLGSQYHSYPYNCCEDVLKELKSIASASLLNVPILLTTKVTSQTYKLFREDEGSTMPNFRLDILKQYADYSFVLSKSKTLIDNNLAYLKMEGQSQLFTLRFDPDTNLFSDNNQIIHQEESYLERYERLQKRKATFSSHPSVGTFWESLKQGE